MTEPPRYTEREEDAGRGAASSTPRWMFVLGVIIAIAVVALIVLLHLTGAIGPGVH